VKLIDKKFMYNNQVHPFHLVDPSPWPLVAAIGAFGITSSFIFIFHGIDNGSFLLKLALLLTIFVMFVWWRDIIREATFEGQHTHAVEVNMRLGMILFIVSEVMFFFAFFWAFFYSSINPTIEIGSIWPPKGIEVPNPFSIPLLNTVILISSGATVTVCHKSIVAGNRKLSIDFLCYTLGLAVFFLLLQLFEYNVANFTISDSIYGSCFYMATGFHGFHVIIGTLFLGVCLARLYLYHFTRDHHFGLEAAIWYWHFVDGVWIYLYFCVYWWGGS